MRLLVTALAAIGLVGVAWSRLVNLDTFVGKFDEGIRGGQLLLMAAGYRPFRDIFASQGPLSLDIYYPAFMLFGETLGAARVTPAVLSIVGLVLTAVAARMVAGNVAGFVAGGILALSPAFLKNARLALVEVPALAPATGAVVAMLAYQAGAGRGWLAGSAVLAALAVLIKPMVLPVMAPLAILLLVRRDRGPARWAVDALVFGGVGLVVAAAIIGLYGPADVYEQMVRFRAASRQVEPWSLRENWVAMSGELVDEQMALWVASLLAAVLAVSRRPVVGLALVSWPVASFALLMFYSPLQFKHAVIMLPPVALLVGVGAGFWWPGLRSVVAGARAPLALGGAAFGLGVAVWYGASLPALYALDRRVIQALPDRDPETYDEEVELIAALTRPNQFVLVDEPYVAFGARRLVPPSLVDTSMVRIRSRTLDAPELIGASQRFDVQAMMLFTDGLRRVTRFADWVDEAFVPVKVNERRNGKDRAIYVRRDGDLAGARAVLDATVSGRSGTEFGGELRLLGHAIDRPEVRPGGAIGLTLGWEALGRPTADWHVLTILKDQRGAVAEQNERGLGGGADGTATWEPGRWVYRTSSLTVRPSVRPGEYQLYVSLYDSKARRLLPIDAAGATEAPIAAITVRS
ncbi:MAG: glycosyltransferase family 39 protein [Chloroflexota bacterium]